MFGDSFFMMLLDKLMLMFFLTSPCLNTLASGFDVYTLGAPISLCSWAWSKFAQLVQVTLASVQQISCDVLSRAQKKRKAELSRMDFTSIRSFLQVLS